MSRSLYIYNNSNSHHGLFKIICCNYYYKATVNNNEYHHINISTIVMLTSENYHADRNETEFIIFFTHFRSWISQ